MTAKTAFQSDLSRFFASCDSDVSRARAIENVHTSPEARALIRDRLQRFADLGRGNARDWAKRHLRTLDALP